MRNPVSLCLILGVLLLVGQRATHPATTGGASDVRALLGEIELGEVSGAAVVRNGELVILADEGSTLYRLPEPGKTLLAGKIGAREMVPWKDFSEARLSLDDLEDAAFDGVGMLYLITSHSRTRRGDGPPERYRLAGLRVDATGRLLEARQTDALLKGIVSQIPFLADAIRRTPARTGLNIEGLAWQPEQGLLVGLRAPTITESTPRPHGAQEDAVVLRLANPEACLGGAEPIFGDTSKIDLQGQGIRGMVWDVKKGGCWILSGLSADPGHPVRSPWGLWFWKGSGAPIRIEVPKSLDLSQPEAIVRVETEKGPRLLIVDDSGKRSPYALLPIPATGS